MRPFCFCNRSLSFVDVRFSINQRSLSSVIKLYWLVSPRIISLGSTQGPTDFLLQESSSSAGSSVIQRVLNEVLYVIYSVWREVLHTKLLLR